MTLATRDRTFNNKKISYLDFKQIEMDRVLTALFARLAHLPAVSNDDMSCL